MATKLNIPTEEVEEQEIASQNVIDALNKVALKRKELDEALGNRKECMKNDMTLIRKMANKIRNSKGYTEPIGQELGIVGTEVAIDDKTLRLTLKLTVYPGYVKVAFNKQRMPAISIYSRLKGTEGWTKITNDYVSPYVDRRPLAEAGRPENREYMATYFNGREDIGQQSDIASITFGR